MSANINNCNACATNTCTEVYHKQIRDEPEKKGILDKVKDTVEGAYEKVTGKDKDPQYQMRKDFNKTEERAEDLMKEGRHVLASTEKDMKKATKAQEKAAEQAAKANEATAHALNKQVEGQDKLATAGQKMMEAGAKLQQEAAASQTAASVPVNAHQLGQVHQQTMSTGCTAQIQNQEEMVVRQTEATSHIANPFHLVADYNGKKVALNLDSSATVETTLTRIQTELGTSGKQYLLLDGKQLDKANATLAELKVPTNCTIHVVDRLHAGAAGLKVAKKQVGDKAIEDWSLEELSQKVFDDYVRLQGLGTFGENKTGSLDWTLDGFEKLQCKTHGATLRNVLASAPSKIDTSSNAHTHPVSVTNTASWSASIANEESSGQYEGGARITTKKEQEGIETYEMNYH